MYLLVFAGALVLFHFESGWLAVGALCAIAGVAFAIDFLDRRRWSQEERDAWNPVVPEGKKLQTFRSPGVQRLFVGIAMVFAGGSLTYYRPAHVVGWVIFGAGWAVAIWGGVLMRRGV